MFGLEISVASLSNFEIVALVYMTCIQTFFSSVNMESDTMPICMAVMLHSNQVAACTI